MPRKTTQEEFIALAKQVHSGRYDYSQLHYVNTNADVVIVCPVHGPFKQKAKIHLESDQTKAAFLAQSKTHMLVLTYEDYAASRVLTILSEWFAQRGVEHELYRPKTYKVD